MKPNKRSSVNYRCECCDVTISVPSLLRAHLYSKRHVKYADGNNTKILKKRSYYSPFICEVCDIDFYSEKYYSMHLTRPKHLLKVTNNKNGNLNSEQIDNYSDNNEFPVNDNTEHNIDPNVDNTINTTINQPANEISDSNISKTSNISPDRFSFPNENVTKNIIKDRPIISSYVVTFPESLSTLDNNNYYYRDNLYHCDCFLYKFPNYVLYTICEMGNCIITPPFNVIDYDFPHYALSPIEEYRYDIDNSYYVHRETLYNYPGCYEKLNYKSDFESRDNTNKLSRESREIIRHRNAEQISFDDKRLSEFRTEIERQKFRNMKTDCTDDGNCCSDRAQVRIINDNNDVIFTNRNSLKKVDSISKHRPSKLEMSNNNSVTYQNERDKVFSVNDYLVENNINSNIKKTAIRDQGLINDGQSSKNNRKRRRPAKSEFFKGGNVKSENGKPRVYRTRLFVNSNRQAFTKSR